MTSAAAPTTTPASAASPAGLGEDDATLAVLARATRARGYAPHTRLVEGAAVRDVAGRTYAAATVEHRDAALTTSALRGAVAAAASSGAREFESAVVVTDGLVSAADLAVLREFGVGTPVHVVSADGSLRTTLAT